MTYNTNSSPNDPELYGFPSGTYYDNSIIYPGTGHFQKSCLKQSPGDLERRFN